MKRRDFLKYSGLTAAGLGFNSMYPLESLAHEAAPPLKKPQSEPAEGDSSFVRPAMFYNKLDNGRIECGLCPWNCRVSDGSRGRCGVRENRDGDYYTLVYGRTVALHNDPMEKKPFYHFRPGTMVLSLATPGCNIVCKFCQNWQISQAKPEEIDAFYLSPQKVVKLALEKNIPSIALTYAEPTIFFEYMHDIAKLAKESGIDCVVVSNGFISEQAVKKLAPFLSAYKVDLKGFTEQYYREYCSARLKPVMETLETLMETGLWVEIVNLVLPTANDDEKDIRRMSRWIKERLGAMVPIHFSRFHPMYKLRNLPPTPVSTLEKCYKAARDEGLKYVYIGNVPGLPQGNTYCHKCNKPVIERIGMWDVESVIKAGACPYCGEQIPGVWA